MCDHCGCRDFAPIAELTEEHVRILEMAWTLAEATLAGADQPAEVVASLSALLAVHAEKEETGLYPELIELGGLEQDDCAVLEDEHREVLAALAAGRFDRADYFALAAHIEVEEMELFSAARFRFDDTDWDEMAAAHHAAHHAADHAADHAASQAIPAAQ